LGLLFLFLFILGGILLYKYKGRQSPQEVAIQNKKKHQYILEKIKQFQISKQQAQQQLITGLPHWENEYVANLLNPTTTFFAEKLVH
jgi:lipopolysaccharide export system protein LptC